MAETETIAKMADKLSRELFGVFGWERVDPVNQNWPCEAAEQHGKSNQKKTHPTDVVFRFDHPYRPVTVHLNTDLKSYAAGSISKGAVSGALRSLAASVHCANVSSTWQGLYVHHGVNPEISGLLFIYNHDSDYDKSFDDLLQSVDPKATSPTKSQRVYVIGPQRIAYLATVANDIRLLRGDQRIPHPPSFWYYYPDLITVHTREERPKAATLEVLTGPLLVARYQVTREDRLINGALVYYARDGSTVDEFKYLIDYLFRYQILVTNDEILVRLGAGVPQAAAIFRQAVDAYVSDLHGLPEIRDRLKRVTVESLTKIVTRFSEVELGMD